MLYLISTCNKNHSNLRIIHIKNNEKKKKMNININRRIKMHSTPRYELSLNFSIFFLLRICALNKGCVRAIYNLTVLSNVYEFKLWLCYTLFLSWIVWIRQNTAMEQPKNWKRIIANAFTFGLALEVAAIGTAYFLYRKYKTDPGKFAIRYNNHHKRDSRCVLYSQHFET